MDRIIDRYLLKDETLFFKSNLVSIKSMMSTLVHINKFNVFVVLSIVAAAALFGGAMVTPALAQDNMTMTMDNSSMTMHDMGNTTMNMDK